MKKHLLLAFALLFQFTLLFGQATRYVSAKKLNLRDQPDKNGAVIQALSQGTEVEVLEEYQDGWSRVTVNGTEGYLSTNFLSEEAPNSTSADTESEEAPHASPQQTRAPSAPKAARKEATVYICDSRTAYAYHSSTSCRGLNRCSHPLVSVKESEAISSYGRQACKICY